MQSRRTYRIAFFALLALGAVVRLFGAWCYRGNFHPDAGIVALMAKHMAEGRGFPVFYYGQPYMGSLEPMVAAVFCRLFGCSGLVVCMGTALFAFLLLPVVYAWAKDGDGKTAGIAAMAYCLVGTGGYFHYMSSTRGGGYAAMLLLGTSVIWLSGRIVAWEHRGERRHWAWFFLLGLVAGLAWWTNQPTSAAILASAILFVVILGRRVFTWRLLAGACGFILGSLPLWVWNAGNNWATFAFMSALKTTGSFRGLFLFLPRRVSDLLDLGILAPTVFVAAIVLYGGFFLIFLVTGIIRIARQRGTHKHVPVLAVMLFIVVFCVLFSFSDLARLRKATYVLPLLPAVAVVIGLATARLVRWLPHGLGWLPLVGLIAIHAAAVLPGNFARGLVYPAQMSDIKEFGDFLREQGIEAVYTPYYGVYSRNFPLNEEFCLTKLEAERYPPYTAVAESATSVGIMQDYGGILGLLAGSGGSARTADVLGKPMVYDFSPPWDPLEEISPRNWRAVTDTEGRSLFDKLADRDVGTFVRHRVTGGSVEHVTISFDRPRTVSAVRLMNRNGDFTYPPICEIKGRDSHDSPWRTVKDPVPVSGYY